MRNTWYVDFIGLNNFITATNWTYVGTAGPIRLYLDFTIFWIISFLTKAYKNTLPSYHRHLLRMTFRSPHLIFNAPQSIKLLRKHLFQPLGRSSSSSKPHLYFYFLHAECWTTGTIRRQRSCHQRTELEPFEILLLTSPPFPSAPQHLSDNATRR